MAAHWKTQIEQVEKEYTRWYERCKKISKKYRDERNVIDDEQKSLNLFWANTQTLKPAIYSKVPIPICERRFLDKDTTGRVAAQILERCLRYEVSMCGLHQSVSRSVLDYLVVGRGQCWIRYNPVFGEPISPKVQADDEIMDEGGVKPLEVDKEAKEDADDRSVEADSLCVDYVHWQDYYQFPANCRTEDEIEGKGRRIYMSRQDLIEKFGEKIGKAVHLDHVPKSLPDSGSASLVTGQEGMQATVYEIWWKPTKSIYFIAKEYDKILEEVDDPLHLEGFFPCPPALYATYTNDTMIPVPDYAESQDQYVQIDHLTKRIAVITEAMMVRGCYDGSSPELKRIFEEGREPELFAVNTWASFAEKGGLKSAIDFVPLDMLAQTLQHLINVRTQIIQDLDRITGIPDIMRGTSDARETMGAQRLKQNNGQNRLQSRQDDVALFCRNIINIMGELISEHFDEKTLIQVSGALYDEGMDPPAQAPQQMNQQMPLPAAPGQQPPGMMGSPPGTQMPGGMPPQQGQPIQLPQEPPQMKEMRKMMLIQNAIDLLRQDKVRGFRIDIETDSTIMGDAQQEKQDRISFIEGVTKFIETAAQVTVGVPAFAPLAAKMLQFGVRGYRVGRDLESAIEDFADDAEIQAKQRAGQPPPPDPKMQVEQIKAQAEIQSQNIQAQSEQRNLTMEAQLKQMDMAMKRMEMQIEQMRANAEVAKMHIEMQQDRSEHHMGVVEHGQKMELLGAQHRAKMKEARKPNG